MQYKIAQLSLSASKKDDSIGEIFIAQTDLNKEALLGKIFIIIENHSKEPADYKLVNFLLAEINKNYYQNDKAIMRERLKSIGVEQVFESCLAKTNKALYDQLTNRKLEINLNALNITIGVIHENEVHFTILGKNRLFLIYQNKGPQEIGFSIKEIAASETGLEINYNKLFANLMNGQIPIGGYLFFTNEALPEYVGSNQLAEIISTLPPLGAVEQLKNKLEQVNAYISFYAILIKNTLGVATADPPKRRSNLEANQSIQNLRTTESKTEKLLTPSGLIDFKNWLARARQFLNFGRYRSDQLFLASRTALREKFPVRKRLSLRALKNLGRETIHFFGACLSLGAGLLHASHQLLEQKTWRNLGRLLLKKNIEFLRSPLLWYRTLSQRNKIFITSGLTFILLFTLNLFYMNYRNQQRESSEFYSATLAQIEQKENQIEGNLIPKNYSGAKTLALETKALIAQLPARKTADPKLTDLQKRLEDLESQIRRETEAETVLLAALDNFNQAAQPQNLQLYKNKLYLADTANKTIYLVDPVSKVVSSYGKSLEQINSLKSVALDRNLLYFWNSGKIFIYNLDKLEGKDYEIVGLDSLGPETQLGVFSGRAYVTAPQDGQIYRLDYQNNAFRQPKAWLKTAVSLENLQSFYLDGNAYLLYKDGRIEKFIRGLKQNWQPEALNPVLESSSTLTTGDKYLYLADPKNQRIVILDKNGKLIKQLSNPKLTNITAMVVDETNKVLYALNGQNILQVSLKDK